MILVTGCAGFIGSKIEESYRAILSPTFTVRAVLSTHFVAEVPFAI